MAGAPPPALATRLVVTCGPCPPAVRIVSGFWQCVGAISALQSPIQPRSQTGAELMRRLLPTHATTRRSRRQLAFAVLHACERDVLTSPEAVVAAARALSLSNPAASGEWCRHCADAVAELGRVAGRLKLDAEQLGTFAQGVSSLTRLSDIGNAVFVPALHAAAEGGRLTREPNWVHLSSIVEAAVLVNDRSPEWSRLKQELLESLATSTHLPAAPLLLSLVDGLSAEPGAEEVVRRMLLHVTGGSPKDLLPRSVFTFTRLLLSTGLRDRACLDFALKALRVNAIRTDTPKLVALLSIWKELCRPLGFPQPHALAAASVVGDALLLRAATLSADHCVTVAAAASRVVGTASALHDAVTERVLQIGAASLSPGQLVSVTLSLSTLRPRNLVPALQALAKEAVAQQRQLRVGDLCKVGLALALHEETMQAASNLLECIPPDAGLSPGQTAALVHSLLRVDPTSKSVFRLAQQSLSRAARISGNLLDGMSGGWRDAAAASTVLMALVKLSQRQPPVLPSAEVCGDTAESLQLVARAVLRLAASADAPDRRRAVGCVAWAARHSFIDDAVLRADIDSVLGGGTEARHKCFPSPGSLEPDCEMLLDVLGEGPEDTPSCQTSAPVVHCVGATCYVEHTPAPSYAWVKFAIPSVSIRVVELS
eukprot:TRINITY_DN13833_c0_g1_i2.p1 TRINITY_DN13833_c0_g1~~TRINITY_DN13833_c0_g1_i2.p1  ORF type:complete len:671 (+),score=145.89 TRINITY_DN13833_c0_g1_i2:49-2013(+)